MPSNSREIGALTRQTAEEFKRLRLQRNLSQSELATRSGLARNTYSAIERGETAIDLEQLARITYALDVSTNGLLMTAMIETWRTSGRLPRPQLTPREVEVLRTWLEFDTAAAAADLLDITPETLNSHLKRIRTKYGRVGRYSPTKAELLINALWDGFVPIDSLMPGSSVASRRKRR